jgi:hypothetical protein
MAMKKNNPAVTGKTKDAFDGFCGADFCFDDMVGGKT